MRGIGSPFVGSPSDGAEVTCACHFHAVFRLKAVLRTNAACRAQTYRIQFSRPIFLPCGNHVTAKIEFCTSEPHPQMLDDRFERGKVAGRGEGDSC